MQETWTSRQGICEVAGNPFDKHRVPIHPEWARLSDPLPFQTPALATPRYPGCSRVRQLQCYGIGARERDERGRMGGAGVVSRRRYRPLSNPVATLKGNRRKRGRGAFNSSQFRLTIFVRKERRAIFIVLFYYWTLLWTCSIVDETYILSGRIFLNGTIPFLNATSRFPNWVTFTFIF